MTFQEFINKWNNKGIDFDGAYGDQCMDLMHQYIVEVIGLADGRILAAPAAKDVYLNFANIIGNEHFEQIANTPQGVPQNGDIVLWGTGIGPYGHVAIFIEGDQNKFRSFDQNFPTNSKCHVQEHTYKGVLGWLHPKPNVSMATITQAELDEMRARRDELYNITEEQKKQIANLTKDLQDTEGKLGQCLKTAEEINDQDKNTTAQLIDAQKALKPYQDLITAAKKELSVTDDSQLIQALKDLKKSKVRTMPKPESFIEKLKFLFS